MQQVLVTRIGERTVGWPTGCLEEISAMPRLFNLPQPYPHVMATAFMRGRLITVVNTCSLVGQPDEPLEAGLLLRMAPPSSHLAFAVPAIEAVVPYHELSLREDEAEGIWAGIYPWQDAWVSVIKPEAVVTDLGLAIAMSIRNQTTGREHAS